MEKKVIKLLAEVLNLSYEKIAGINGDDNLIEYALDSLTAIELVVNLESEFDIEVDEDDLLIEKLDTINKIILLIKKYISK